MNKLRSIHFFYKANHKNFRPLLSYTYNYSSIGTSKNTAQRVQSSAPAGTILKGLNLYKNGADPIALPDDEYPDWLWKILDREKEEQLRSNENSRQYHRKQRKDLIKNNNFDRNRRK